MLLGGELVGCNVGLGYELSRKIARQNYLLLAQLRLPLDLQVLPLVPSYFVGR